VELLARLAARAGLFGGYEALFSLHDDFVAAWPWPLDTDAVYAYEDGALRTFRKARSRGIACVWDLPLPHWATLDRTWRGEFARWPGAMGGSPGEPDWKRRRKDEELALADVVSVASRFTRHSLEAIGCTKPIVEVPYGFPVDSFRPKPRALDGPFTVLAVGTQDLRKGTPYLLEAWRRAGPRDARLRLVGPMRLTDAFLAPYRGTFEHVPHLPRSVLEAEYQGADLLVFPTLGDGFGLVVQEAMCCATPVLTTPCGGGPECIDDGVEGWIVTPRDADALAERLRWAAANRDRLGVMGRAARRRAESHDAHAAGHVLVARLEQALGTETEA
jgi:glycosyltransferase involved in cell wall biosynthesis